MASTSTSTAAAATCTGNAWVLPVQDIACGITTNTDNTTSIMDKCCADASVETYNDDCGLYCLAQGQTGQELLDCLRDEGATDGQYFCGGRLNETSSTPVSNNDDDDDNNDDDGDDEPSSTDDAEDPETTDNAAVLAGQPVSKAGLGVLAMLVVSAVMGVVA